MFFRKEKKKKKRKVKCRIKCNTGVKNVAIKSAKMDVKLGRVLH